MKCREKVEVKDANVVTMKTGRKATQGRCPKCDTKVFTMKVEETASAEE